MIWILFIFIPIVVILLIISFMDFGSSNYEEIETLIKEEKYEEAIPVIEKGLEKKKDDKILYSYKIKILELKKNWDKFFQELAKLKDRDEYLPEYDKERVLTKLGDYAYQKEDYEKALSIYLELLIDYSENLNALKKIGFMAVGRAEFSIGTEYLDKAYEIEKDDQTALTLAIAYHERGLENKAFEIFEKLLEKNPDDVNLNIFFIIMSQKSHHASAREKILQYYDVVSDLQIKFLFIKMYVYFSFHMERQDEILGFLRRAAEKDEFNSDQLKEIVYYSLLFHLLKQNFDEAKNFLKRLKNIDSGNKNIETFENFIIRKKLSFTEENNEIHLNQIIARDFENILPEQFLFRISGLQLKNEINFSRFFQYEDGKRVLKKEFQKLDISTVMGDFISLDPENFKNFCEFTIKNLEYIPEKRIPAIEENDLEFICHKEKDDRIRALISFYRKKPDSKISEIELENYQAKINEIKVSTGIIITNASISLGSEKKLQEYKNIQILTHERVKDIYKNWKKSL